MIIVHNISCDADEHFGVGLKFENGERLSRLLINADNFPIAF